MRMRWMFSFLFACDMMVPCAAAKAQLLEMEQEMTEIFARTARLIGEENIEKLSRAHVALFGVGGVGGYVAEALVRSGVGEMTLFDNDVVAQSNLNRQIIALHSTLGKKKVQAMRERMQDINPDMVVHAQEMFYLPENADAVDLSCYDYIVDAVDTVMAKLELAVRAKRAGVPIISSMGTGNKLDPTAFVVADIYETSACPLARVMRRELKKRGVKKLKVVYSKEKPKLPLDETDRRTPASIAFVPPVAGLILASQVIKDLLALI